MDLDLDPDTRLSLLGPHCLGDAELLSFLLTRGGPPGLASLELARAVLRDVGGLRRLVTLPEGRLTQVSGIGPTKARRIIAALALTGRVIDRPIPRGEAVLGPGQLFEMLRGRCLLAGQEKVWVMSLDARGRRLSLGEVARGSRNVVHVSVPDIFRGPLLERADSIYLVHNHPSGDPRPSEADIAMTARLAAAGELLGVDLADHVIVGGGTYVSMKELGYLPKEPVGFVIRAADRCATGVAQ